VFLKRTRLDKGGEGGSKKSIFGRTSLMYDPLGRLRVTNDQATE